LPPESGDCCTTLPICEADVTGSFTKINRRPVAFNVETASVSVWPTAFGTETSGLSPGPRERLIWTCAW